jgi:predicted acetylornithine/succinylornithine family transaminase
MMGTYRRWPIEIASGRGCRLFDTGGKSYLDLMGGIAVASLGHSHPALVKAVSDQVAKLAHVSNLYETGPQKRLAASLADKTGGMKSFFVNSGAEAVECAIKLARKHARAKRGVEIPRIISTANGFHGRTLGALAATGQPSKQAPFAPLPFGFDHVPYGDIDAIASAMSDDTAAVLLEPIQGEAGVIVPPDDYLACVFDLCERNDCLLVLDEVQTGVGRTGTWWAHEPYGVLPHIMCLAKGLGGGLPIGVCLARSDVAASFEPGDHGSTFGGGPVQCSAALAVLEIIEEESLLENVRTVSRQIFSEISEAALPCAIRGRGLLIGLEFEQPIARLIAERALAAGLLVNDATPHVIRLAPPLVITEAEARQATQILREVCLEIAAA